ncbi:CPBP family intramembrane metalloprotease [Vibrio sp.]|nr:CPBP family intramembrane metalloprotease [Vibrio sp.]
MIESFPWQWVLLGSAIIAAFLRCHRFSVGMLALFLLSALVQEYLSLVGLIAFVVLSFNSYTLGNRTAPLPKLQLTLLICGGLVLVLHQMPGFNNPLVLDDVTKSSNSVPFSLYFNADKPLVFFLIVWAFPNLLSRAKRSSSIGIAAGIGIALIVLPAAMISGFLDWSPAIPSWWWIFAFNNLFFTCVSEEVIFRGLLQRKLSDYKGPTIGIVVSSLVFGVVHFMGGWPLVLFASIAGLGYGVVYYHSQRLWIAVLLHFLVNVSHLILFTYPLKL